MTANLWYKNAVIYCLDVETFMDGDGDGVGDFAGLAHRLDHLERLGVNCIWLNPFYPSPNRDNGYDITDYYGVDPRYGNLGDFVEFMQAAQDRGMRVIIDLVVNHTSIDHPWFQSARQSEDSPFRDWYVWSKEKPDNITEGVVFPGVQEAIWSFDRKAGAWYLHRFYKHQPDLNVANPQVRAEILKIMGFWLALGVSGFRVDAVPFLIEDMGLPNGGTQDPFSLLNDMKDFMTWRRAGSVLLAEANIEYELAEDYFDGGNRMSMIFDFPVNQTLFLSLARHTAAPVRQALMHRPDPNGMGQWASFLRNHDELDLARLTKAERGEVFAAFAPDTNMQLYGRGIRRRLAPMLSNDQALIRMAQSLMFALPGTPVMWYGEEIGMGEDLSLKEREAVRTPMQWSDQRNGGFSTAEAAALFRHVPEKGPNGCERINVAEQISNPDSLLHAVTGMIAARRSAPEIGWGEFEVVDLGTDEVLAMSYRWRGGHVVTLHNFTDKPVSFPLEIEGIEHFVPLLSDADNRTPFNSGAKLTLPRFGYCWLRCGGERH
ncbi:MULTISPECIES: alpha-amylase family protein [unclassified Devosia]|uniref:alpha-amylase family protein n=1 Tax=unclassified Devosia TaxID=196773 RepID=UPI000FDCC670|nr:MULTISPECIES: alpha-amylase family protein [unclassified Devosia]